MVFFDEFGIRKRWVYGFLVSALLVVAVMSAAVLGHISSAEAHQPIAYTVPRADDPAFAKTIALTFDDGPHPVFTPRLVELLSAEDVPATFFMIGRHAVQYPVAARSVADAGLEIGNHTFSHSQSVHRSHERFKQELVTTDRILRETTGVATVLYRPPYFVDMDVGDFDIPHHLQSSAWAKESGYIVIGANIDPRDWSVSPPSASALVRTLEERIHDGANLIILHEAAGNGATIEALREFIPRMKAAGYTFVAASAYYGLTTEMVNTPADRASGLDAVLVGSIGALLAWTSSFGLVFGSATILALSKSTLFIAIRKIAVPLARRRARGRVHAHPPISVLIPAHNEEANIVPTIRSALNNTTAHDEILVIDDGSTDRTTEIVRTMSRESHARVRLLRTQNGGKARALTYGLNHVAHQFVLCIDADTVIAPGAVSKLAAHMNDPRVGAVAGKVYPVFHNSLLHAFQYLEYMQGQNIDKEALSLFNGIGVVPGAIGLWRMRAVMDSGGYSEDTVVEDQDLTLALLRHGWRIQYEGEARAFTEAPDNVHALLRQRMRWAFGSLQCVWKYKAHFFSLRNPALGWLVLPLALAYNTLAPILLTVVYGSLVFHAFSLIDLQSLLLPFVVFTLFDAWCAIEALTHEQRPRYRLIAFTLWQRVLYGPLLAAVCVACIYRALLGTIVRWAAPVRRGDCHIALEDSNSIAPEPARA